MKDSELHRRYNPSAHWLLMVSPFGRKRGRVQGHRKNHGLRRERKIFFLKSKEVAGEMVVSIAQKAAC